MDSWNRSIAAIALAVLLGAVQLASAGEEESGERLGGHIGIAVPLVSVADGEATTVDEFTVIAIPMGISVKDAVGPLVFDMELVPAVTGYSDVDVTIHPGLIYPGSLAAVGMRAAFDVDSDAYGFTALVAKPIRLGNRNLFIELDVPVRFPKGPVDAVFGVVTHVGICF